MKASELRIGNFLEFSNGIQPTKTIMVGRRFFLQHPLKKKMVILKLHLIIDR
jgi:hypothetical protein